MPSIKVKGMSCQHCVASVTKALSSIDGLKDIKVDLASGIASYEEDRSVDSEAIKEAVKRIGFDVE